MQINIICACDFYYDDAILFTRAAHLKDQLLIHKYYGIRMMFTYL